ncbi:MAG: hypothetical protein KKD28_11380 [Chloroflexi bacterium]|nr:hypothetical protein [Chloroflexota bacterium]
MKCRKAGSSADTPLDTLTDVIVRRAAISVGTGTGVRPACPHMLQPSKKANAVKPKAQNQAAPEIQQLIVDIAGAISVDEFPFNINLY